MASIPTFGFSAFLRMICLNDRPQKTAVRDRHRPSKKGGYDFHKSLRNGIQQLARGTGSVEQVLGSVSAIVQKPERESATRGIENFSAWIKENPGAITFCDPFIFTSPGGLFRVAFQPDFVIDLSGRKTAVHVWNTKLKLSGNLVMASLTLVAKNWRVYQDCPNDFAVLSLRDDQLYRWSDDPNSHVSAGSAIMSHLDRLCVLARKDFNLPSIGEQPESPPPPAE